MIITQSLVKSQIKYGILDILKEAQPYFPKPPGPSPSIRVNIFFNDASLPNSINLTGWKYNTPMLTGLTKWFRRNSANVGDKVFIEVLGNTYYRLSIRK